MPNQRSRRSPSGAIDDVSLRLQKLEARAYRICVACVGRAGGPQGWRDGDGGVSRGVCAADGGGTQAGDRGGVKKVLRAGYGGDDRDLDGVLWAGFERPS